MDAYELYAGGELVGGVGSLPPLSETNYDRTRVFLIPASAIADDGTLLLALRVWGGTELAVSKWGGGAYEGDFRIGEFATLLQRSFLSEIPGLIASVSFLGFGLYHIYLYHRNRQLRTYLWYGLMALVIGIYGVMVNQWRYSLGWPFVAYEKVEFGMIFLFPAVAIQMMWSLLQLPIGRWLRAYQLSFIAFAILVVLVPGLDIHYYTLRPWQIWSLALLVGIPWMFIREAYSGNAEARTGLVGILVFAAACTNDLLIDFAGWEGTRLVPLGFAAIMLFMAISLANRFTTVFTSLEDEVTQRTAELRIANKHLTESARLDPLTGVLNRRGFSEKAEAEVQRVVRTGRELSIVLADLDNFKAFNDQHGHACGDYVLREAANLLSEGVRSMDSIARWGGEEFMLVLPETSAEGAALLAEKLCSTLEARRFEFGGQRLGVTMTFGLATFRKGETLENCIARADAALYQGKDQGRNRVMVGA
ncbi:MAG: GGDEF domain-containing protein [Gammaproteobacteria bacterium]|nr:GGDEF domain-containing protein [Gammaproteobacteria bacterium]